MAELIKNFSGTDVAIWAENEQSYYLGDVTLPPGRYYFVFNKISGTLPSKHGGFIYYSYSAGVAGIDSVGINNYGSTTSGIYEIQSTREGSAYIWSNLSRFDTNGDPPQDELQSDPPTKKPESALPWVWAAGSGLHPTPNHPHRRSGPQTQQCWSGGP